MFGQSSSASSSAFGHQSQGSLFGSHAGGFGQSTMTSASGFGQQTSIFGQTPSSGSPLSLQSSAFGQSTTSSVFSPTMASVFGQQTSPSSFGTVTSSSVFGQQTSSIFGQTPSTASPFGQQSSTAFCQNSGILSPFGQSTTSTGFNQMTGPVFGQQTSSTMQPTASTSSFGYPANPAFGQTTTSSSIFGPQSSTFGQQSSTPQSTLQFGQQSTTMQGPSISQNTLSSPFSFGPSRFGQFGTTGSSGNLTTSSPSIFSISTTSQSIFGGTKKTPVPSIFGGITTTSQGLVGDTSGLSNTGRSIFGVGSDTGETGSSGGFNFIDSSSTKPRRSSFSGSVSSQDVPTQTTSTTGLSKNLFGKKIVSEDEKKPLGFSVTARRISAQEDKQLSPPATVFIVQNQDTKPIDSSKGQAGERAVSGLFGKGGTSKDPPSYASSVLGKTGSTMPKTLFGKSVAESSKQGQGSKETIQTSRFTWKRKEITEDEKRVIRKLSDESVEEPQAKRASLTRMTSFEDQERVAIVCKNVPAKYNNAFLLKKHFGQFGEISRVFPQPQKKSAIVHFKLHNGAYEAKKRGRLIEKGFRPMEIFWSSYSPGGSRVMMRKSSNEEVITPSQKRAAEDNSKKPVKKGLKWAEDEVSEELRSMSGTEDVSKEKIKKVDRPRNSNRPSGSGVRHSSPVPTPSSSDSKIVNNQQKVDKGSISILKTSIAHNSSEKLNLLNLRDKIMRQGNKREADLAAKAFVGTCLEMCPEKERYDREEKRRLHPFEILQGTESNPLVDHSRAVKEYSRSSADQEEPLPHELRSLSALTTTMNYILTEIAELGEDGKWGDWFDFFWNRTRGIRKEITQQQLCNVESAALLEKCVRFHIFCAERLCEEDMHSFDDKINNENMTKCLQTLKEFYHDLEVKQNVFCPNEAEMRCYVVLMNLNEGDTLRETQQLRPAVRNSPWIKFALQVYSALNSKNYVRFFRMVKQGTFLCACIMHRYFTQVRLSAIKIILRSYQKGTQLPLDDLVRKLGFEDKSEAAQFCSFNGLQADENFVILDKSRYIEAEEKWPPRRSTNLIESKRTMTVGEAINGEPLPPLILPTPTLSFDENGRFIGKIDIQVSEIGDIAIKASPRAQDVPVIPPVTSNRIQQEEVKPKPFTFNNEQVKETAKQLFWEVIDELCNGLALETLREVGILMEHSVTLYEDISSEVVSEITQILCQSIVSELRKVEKEKMITKSAVLITTEVIKEVLDQDVLNIATAEIREVNAELKRQRIERCSQSLSEEILETTVQDLLSSVSNAVYQTDVIERLAQLEENRQTIELLRTKHWLEKWQKECAARKNLKRSMLDFPACPTLSLGDSVEHLSGQRSLDCDGFYVNKSVKLASESMFDTYMKGKAADELYEAQMAFQNACHIRAWHHVDLCRVAEKEFIQLGKTIKAKYKGKYPWKKLYWKLVISLPDSDNFHTEHQGQSQKYLKKWIRTKFLREETSATSSTPKEEVLSCYSCNLPPSSQMTSKQLAVVVRSIEGVVDDITINLLGTSAILFVLPPAISEDPELLYWSEESQRLDSLLKSKPPYPAVPLVILCPISAKERLDQDFLSRCLNLEDYIDEGLISEVYISLLDYNEDWWNGFEIEKPEINDEFDSCLQWFISAYPTPPPLCVQSIRDFTTSFLKKTFYRPVLHDLKWRKSKGYLHLELNKLICLYNDVISHLLKVIQSSTPLKFSWPVLEMTYLNNSEDNELPPCNWSSRNYQERLTKVVEGLTLPMYDVMDPENDDWAAALEDIRNYLLNVQGSGSIESAELTRRVELRLQRTQQDFEDACYSLCRETGLQPLYNNVPWTDIMLDCVYFKLQTIDYIDHFIEGEQGTHELKVVYLDSELQRFSHSSDWEEVDVFVDKEAHVSSLEESVLQAREKRHRTAKARTAESHETKKFYPHIPLKPLSKLELDVNKSAYDLHLALEKEKQETEKIEKELHKALHCENLCEIGEETLDSDTEISELSTTPQRKVTALPLKVKRLNLDLFNVSSVSDLSHDSLSRPSSLSRDSSSQPSLFSHQTSGDLSLLEDQDHTVNNDDNSMSVWEKMYTLKEDLGSEKKANEEFERELVNLIAEGSQGLPNYLKI